MDVPDWAVVLSHLYNNEGEFLVELEVDSVDRGKPEYVTPPEELLHSSMSEELGLQDPDTVKSAINLLSKSGLIEKPFGATQSPSKQYGIEMTKDGFEVAHDREIEQQQQEMEAQLSKRQNRLMKQTTILTGLLVVTGGLNALVAMFPDGLTLISTLAVGLLLAFVLGFAGSTIIVQLWED